MDGIIRIDTFMVPIPQNAECSWGMWGWDGVGVGVVVCLNKC